VLEALLWAFHNAKSGLCFRGYEKIAEGGGWLRRSTAAEAIKALKDAGVLSWVQRIRRAPLAASGPPVSGGKRHSTERIQEPYQRLARKTEHWQAIASMATEAPLRVLAGRN
jgi:hypothetical protein